MSLQDKLNSPASVAEDGDSEVNSGLQDDILAAENGGADQLQERLAEARMSMQAKAGITSSAVSADSITETAPQVEVSMDAPADGVTYYSNLEHMPVSVPLPNNVTAAFPYTTTDEDEIALLDGLVNNDNLPHIVSTKVED